jgi:nucleoside 2-deoxyribosyltransferase
MRSMVEGASSADAPPTAQCAVPPPRYAGRDEAGAPIGRFCLLRSRRDEEAAETMMTKLYLAGPLFTLAEQRFNAELARFLESEDFEVWLPQDHEPRSKTAKSIFQMDVAALDWADMVVAGMDGPDPDSGTAWECGYAYAKGKPIVCYRTDFRITGDTKGAPYNLMLSESATARFELPFRAKPAEFQRRVLAQIRKALRAKPPRRKRTRIPAGKTGGRT